MSGRWSSAVGHQPFRAMAFLQLYGFRGQWVPQNCKPKRRLLQAAVACLLRTASCDLCELANGGFRALAQVRINSGYAQYSLVSLGSLTEFLPAAVHLSQAEVRKFDPRRRKCALLHACNKADECIKRRLIATHVLQQIGFLKRK